MRSDSFRRLAAAAGMASATAVAGAQIPAEVTVPLGDSYSANCPNCPQGGYGATGYGYGATGYGSTGVVYGPHGGQFDAYSGTGAGYIPPARYPVERIPVQYLRYYPAVWYGLPGSTLPVVAPQVHMPTDTTQLGFYYQRVPTWVPVPGMIPGPPNPDLIHSVGPGVTGAALTDGATVNGTLGNTNEQVISTRPVSTGTSGSTKGTKAGAHTPSGSTNTDPGTVPVPPSPKGGSRLPLQPPEAPAAEPAAFVPPPAPAPLLPVGIEDAI